MHVTMDSVTRKIKLRAAETHVKVLTEEGKSRAFSFGIHNKETECGGGGEHVAKYFFLPFITDHQIPLLA